MSTSSHALQTSPERVQEVLSQVEHAWAEVTAEGSAHAHRRALGRQLLHLVENAPGASRRAAALLADKAHPEAIDTLLAMPAGTPGIVEGVHRGLRGGVTRHFSHGTTSPFAMALEFRHSRARAFPLLLTRARACAPVERLRCGKTLIYRIQLTPRDLREPPPDRLADLRYLHRQLLRNKGTRLWLNGWCFDGMPPLSSAAQPHLLEAWIDAARSRHTKAPHGR